MFTGLVEALGEVESVSSDGAGRRLAVRVPRGWNGDTALGDSIAVSGVCLTAVTVEPERLVFDLAEETLRVTTLGDLVMGDAVNLERPLRLGARLGGHLVLGHVDGVGRVAVAEAEGAGRRLTIAAPDGLRPLLIPKGSVAVDGVSLTIARLAEATFSVALIPHTLAATTLGRCAAGARVNLEMDVIGKYVRALLPAGPRPAARAGSRAKRAGRGRKTKAGEAREFLERHGVLAPTREGSG
jgi:riboflavin synthase alpha subunit